MPTKTKPAKITSNCGVSPVSFLILNLITLIDYYYWSNPIYRIYFCINKAGGLSRHFPNVICMDTGYYGSNYQMNDKV